MRRFSQVGLLAVSSVILFAQPALPQNSIGDLDHYRIVPRYSVLRETGGFAGVDNRYRLMGKYDLLHNIGGTPRARFENAEVWGSPISDGPVIAIVLDVDELLNLEELKGEQLPVAAPFDVYQFTGNMDDGSSVNLFASVIGPWMYLRGHTEPPPGSADFFEYQIKVLARSPRPFADFNDDGTVDAADFVLDRKNASAADPDVANYADWVQQFGETAPNIDAMDADLSSAVGSSGSTSSGIPEPASVGLALLGSIIVASLRRR
jgi:hypothetical protein